MSQTDKAARLLRRGQDHGSVLPPLLVAADRIAATLAQGFHGRRQVGPGESFWQFRPYQPGDPVQAIDWRQSARGDRVFVREREWEGAQTLWLWRDNSPSMAWTSSPALEHKRDHAGLLAMALAVLLVRGGEKVGLIESGASSSLTGQPTSSRVGLARMAATLSTETVSHEAGLPTLPALPKHAQAVFFGDFLAPAEDMVSAIRAMAGAGLKGHLMQILDPAEETLPYGGRVRFAGLEAESDMLVRRAEDLRDGYRRRLEAHRAIIGETARAVGWTFAVHRTDQPPQHGLLALYQALSLGRMGR